MFVACAKQAKRDKVVGSVPTRSFVESEARSVTSNFGLNRDVSVPSDKSSVLVSVPSVCQQKKDVRTNALLVFLGLPRTSGDLVQYFSDVLVYHANAAFGVIYTRGCLLFGRFFCVCSFPTKIPDVSYRE